MSKNIETVGWGKTFQMKCPKHKEEQLLSSKFVQVRKAGSDEAIRKALFYCSKCDAYYISRPNVKKDGPIATYKDGKPVYAANCGDAPFASMNITSKKIKPASPEPAQKKKKSPGSDKMMQANYKRSQRVSSPKAIIPVKKTPQNKAERKEKPLKMERCARIHIYSEKELRADQRLGIRWENFCLVNQDFADFKGDLNTFLKGAIPEKLSQKCRICAVARGKRGGNTGSGMELYVMTSNIILRRAGKKKCLALSGYLKEGEFFVEDFWIEDQANLSDSDYKEDVLTFYYDGKNRRNVLYEYSNGERKERSAKSAKLLSGELAVWDRYLDWKKQLAQLRIRGIKYIGLKIDAQSQRLTFLTVTDGKEEFKGFSRYFREVSAFSNRYSSDPLRFKFNNEENGGADYDSGIPLNFARVGRRCQDAAEIYGEEWDELRPFCRQLPAETGEERRRKDDIHILLEKISGAYEDPYFCELEFELTERGEELIRRQLRYQGTVSEEITQTLAGEFYGDGYIATSEVGSFALIKRCKNAVKELNEGQSASPRLEQWLFDIHKAQLPGRKEPVAHWQNPAINPSQKQAVEKILSAPDICLIQGPPGTGKTTVIAEAVWQLVLRGQRVLISSQANLAVDNALDRIVSDPRVRAIRLGKTSKIDASVSDITEDHVLETFYHSLVEFVSRSYLKPWHESKHILEETQKDMEIAKKAREMIRRITREIESISGLLEEVRKQKEQYDVEERLDEAMGEKAVFTLERNIKSYRKKKMRRELGGISLEEMVESVTKTAALLKQEIQKKKEKISKEKEQLQAAEEELSERLKVQAREKEEQEAAILAMLERYPEYTGSLEQRIQEKKRKLTGGVNSKVKREDWEGIFEGLTRWVEQIPDYAQEREIYLKDFINGCNVVGVSCTENGKTLIENGFDQFDVVIIDEVSKATPPELLIPMMRGRKVVLVGDHRQLPPLFNEHETSYLEAVQQYEGDEAAPLTMEDFNRYKDMVTSSLFERYFNQADPSIKETLAIQYRMHPDIMELINLFYGGQLKDGNRDRADDAKAHGLRIDSVDEMKMIVPECHAYWFDSSELLGKMVLEQRREGSSSAENLAEAQMILELLRKVEFAYREMNLGRRVTVGVISFYFDQVALIRRILRSESFYAVDVEVNTVDRFQGKEKEIIFVSLVRNVRSAYRGIHSHIAAFQRINVAFSRAQNLLVIVGARNMYADQPVVIPDLNTGEERTLKVYRQIIEKLYLKNAYFTGDDVIPAATALKILEKLG